VVKQESNVLEVKIKDGATTNNVLQYFIQEGVGVTAFHEILPTLNDIFIKVVGNTPLARQFETVQQ
jgi:ABC-2 type transport system ATP-binding protein